MTWVSQRDPGRVVDCFVGTRIAVYDVLHYLASGITSDQIVSDVPELTGEHVRAAIEFAAMRERHLATPA